MSPLSKKLSELRPFSWVKSWQNLKSKKFSNLKISLTFWDLDQFFFSCEVNIYFWKHTQSFKVKQQFRALKLSVGTLEILEIVEIVEIRRILGILEVLGILMDLKRWNLKGFEWKWMDLKIFEGIDWHVWTFMNLFALRSYARMCLF